MSSIRLSIWQLPRLRWPAPRVALQAAGLLWAAWLVAGCHPEVIPLPVTQPVRPSLATATLVPPTAATTLVPSGPVLTTTLPAPVAGTPASGQVVQGGLVLQGGGCCIGGVVGSRARLRVDFSAQSSAAPVTEMRLHLGGACASDGQMEALAWEPFRPNQEQEITISTINWIGLYISVQYRDSQGHRSPVYCQDISVEGMPAPPASATP